MLLIKNTTTTRFPVSPRCPYLPLEAAGGPPNPVATGYTIGGSAPNAVDRMIRFYPYARGAESSIDESLELNTYDELNRRSGTCPGRVEGIRVHSS